MHKRLVFGFAFLALGSSFATAQDSDRWLRLGQRDLDPRGERVVVPISPRATLEALVLGVDNAAVRVLDAKIQLFNGQVVNWPIRGVLYAGQRTHVFPLPGRSERRIRSIVLYYETGTRGRRPRGSHFRSLDRDPGAQENAPDWNRDYDRNWDGDWDRSYGRLKPRVSVWGRD
jgi:hypothetical protein